MSYDLNVAVLHGRLTRDVEMSFAGDGKAIGKFAIANNTGKDDKTLSFIDCVAFGKTAEMAQKYLSKGSQVAITGRVSQSRWQSKEGQARSKIEVVVNTIHFIGTKSSGDNGSDFANGAPTGNPFKQAMGGDVSFDPGSFDPPNL